MTYTVDELTIGDTLSTSKYSQYEYLGVYHWQCKRSTGKLLHVQTMSGCKRTINILDVIDVNGVNYEDILIRRVNQYKTMYDKALAKLEQYRT